MEDVDSSEKPESRVDSAKKIFQARKQKSKEELEKTREKMKSTRSKMELPSFMTGKKKKKEKE
tara:strand:- start:62 stop:250 length:189 start_codon:yes stop_codon:yes gene_type:complete